MASYGCAIAIQTDNAEAYSGRGIAFNQMNRVGEAISDYDRAIELKPDFVAPRCNRAFAALMRGDFQQGWQDHEWRWRNWNPGGSTTAGRFRQPPWLGNASLSGATILLHAEQGLGDTIQFCRYARLVADLGANVILEVQRPLMRILSGLDGVAQIVGQGDPIPDFDFHCPLMSLPLAFQTTLSNVPSRVPYLRSDADLRRFWLGRLGERTKPRIGLVWSGGFRPDQPELRYVNGRRNIPLKKLGPLKNLDCEFYGLQKGQPAEAELAALLSDGWDGPPIIDVAPHLRDFAETAALIDHLDLVISVDTSTAHLAGALGRPVWILNRFDTCWRWLLDVPESPWYPTVRLYRQPEPGNWDAVVEAVRVDLARLSATGFASPNRAS